MENITEYRVVSGKRDMKIHAAGYNTYKEALDELIRQQLEYGKRKLRVVKLVPYSNNLRQIKEL